MKTVRELAQPEDEGLFEMANLSPKRTGLPFVVWISPKAGAPHDIRVKVSPGPRVHPSELIAVTVRPDVRIVGGGTLGTRELDLLRQWIELNRDALSDIGTATLNIPKTPSSR